MNRAAIVAVAMCMCAGGCAHTEEAPVSKTATEGKTSASTTSNETARLNKMAARFVPTEIAADASKLPSADRQVLAKLVQASKIVDALFMRQVWAGNEGMLLDLVRDQAPEGRARLHYFLIN